MTLGQRIVRHARITAKAFQGAPDPPFPIHFVNSICNQKCDHYFYWRNLNRRDDLTFDELVGPSWERAPGSPRLCVRAIGSSRFNP